MVRFEDIESAAWKRFAFRGIAQFVFLVVLLYFLNLSASFVASPIWHALGLTVTLRLIEWCLSLGPNLHSHSHLKELQGNQYRSLVESEIKKQGLSRMLKLNWLVGQLKENNRRRV